MTEKEGMENGAVSGDGDYERAQSVRDREYEAEYAKWINGLTPCERARVKSMRLDHAEIDRKAVGRGYDGVEFDRVADQSEGLADLMSEEETDALKLEAMRLVRIVLANIFNPSPGRTVGYEVDVIGIAIGVPGLGSVTAVAAKHGFTKQAISKAAVKFCNDNGLPPSIYMRSEANREVHRVANRRRSKA